MTTMELEARRMELIREIMNIDSIKMLNSIKKSIKELLSVEQKNDDTLMTKEQFLAKIEESERQIREGKYTVCRTKEESRAYLNSL